MDQSRLRCKLQADDDDDHDGDNDDDDDNVVHLDLAEQVTVAMVTISSAFK